MCEDTFSFLVSIANRALALSDQYFKLCYKVDNLKMDSFFSRQAKAKKLFALNLFHKAQNYYHTEQEELPRNQSLKLSNISSQTGDAIIYYKTRILEIDFWLLLKECLQYCEDLPKTIQLILKRELRNIEKRQKEIFNFDNIKLSQADPKKGDSSQRKKQEEFVIYV